VAATLEAPKALAAVPISRPGGVYYKARGEVQSQTGFGLAVEVSHPFVSGPWPGSNKHLLLDDVGSVCHDPAHTRREPFIVAHGSILLFSAHRRGGRPIAAVERALRGRWSRWLRSPPSRPAVETGRPRRPPSVALPRPSRSAPPSRCPGLRRLAPRRLGRPVLLSVGYSTCHWCYVMEEESFEDEEVARTINENYIPIKVDREERPDVDGICMTAVQALTGSGGWPRARRR
jgi:hypothetical protein